MVMLCKVNNLLLRNYSQGIEGIGVSCEHIFVIAMWMSLRCTGCDFFFREH